MLRMTLMTMDYVFLYLTQPASRMANPTCMRRIMNAEVMTQSWSKSSSVAAAGVAAGAAGGAAAGAAGGGVAGAKWFISMDLSDDF
jgi:hypothetical protein